MQKEIILSAKITRFRSAVEEFSPFEWCRHHLEHEPITTTKLRIPGTCFGMQMSKEY